MNGEAETRSSRTRISRDGRPGCIVRSSEKPGGSKRPWAEITCPSSHLAINNTTQLLNTTVPKRVARMVPPDGSPSRLLSETGSTCPVGGICTCSGTTSPHRLPVESMDYVLKSPRPSIDGRAFLYLSFRTFQMGVAKHFIWVNRNKPRDFVGGTLGKGIAITWTDIPSTKGAKGFNVIRLPFPHLVPCLSLLLPTFTHSQPLTSSQGDPAPTATQRERKPHARQGVCFLTRSRPRAPMPGCTRHANISRVPPPSQSQQRPRLRSRPGRAGGRLPIVTSCLRRPLRLFRSGVPCVVPTYAATTSHRFLADVCAYLVLVDPARLVSY